MDISSRALMIQGVDGRVRFTTRSGTVFEAELIRTELSPTTLVVRPVGFEVEIEGFVPAQLRLLASKLRDANRPGEQPPKPDLGALLKEVVRPPELPPKASKAAIARARKALAVVQPGGALETVRQGVSCNLGEELAPAVEHLDEDARQRLLREAVDAGSGLSVAALVRDGDPVDALLARAAATGKLFALHALLDAGADPNAPHQEAPVSGVRSVRSDHRTPLHWALANGHTACVLALLDRGARLVDAPGLVRAVAESKDTRLLADLLRRGLDPNLRDERGHPLLRHLGATLRTDMMQQLIDAGADVNARYPDGSTLLLHSIDLARFKDPRTLFVHDLLKAGADPNLGRLYGRSALALAEDVPFDPGASRRERWLAVWVRDAGGEAVRQEAVPLPEGEPPPPPPPAWKARIDPELARATRYTVHGVALQVSAAVPQVRWTLATTPVPEWCGYGADNIALIRAKLQHTAGPPVGRGDEYETTFEYAWQAAVGGETVLLLVYDVKARSVHVAVSPPGDAAEQAVAALWELLTIAPLGTFSDRFRYDAHGGCRYRSDGVSAFADFPD